MNMKKLLAAVLALVLMLAAAGAYADGITTYVDLVDALKNAKSGDTIVLGGNITKPNPVENGKEISIPAGVTLDGKGYTLTASVVHNYSYNALIGSKYSGVTIKNLTIEYTGSECWSGAINLSGGTVENVTVNGKLAWGVVSAGGEVDVKDSTFDTTSHSLYSESTDGFDEVTNNTFETGSAIILRGDEQFTGNTVKGDEGVTVYTSDATVSGNTFTGDRALEVSKPGAEIRDNQILDGATIKVDNGCDVDLSGNYWGPNGPATSQIENGGNSEVTIENWFTDSTMNNIFDPNAPVVGGAADMPSTGDSSMLMLWAALLTLCAGAAVAMKRAKA